MKIGIDARFWSEQGHGRYIRNLVQELEKIDQENDYVIFMRKADFDKFQSSNPRFQKKLAEVRWYSFGEQTKLLKIFLEANLDLLHVPHFNIPIFYPKPFIVTIHDLTITHFATIRATTLPGPIWRFKRLMYKMVIWIALRRAKKVIAVSNYTKTVTEQFYPFTKNKIIVTQEAVETAFLQDAEGAKADSGQARMTIQNAKTKYNISKQYLLYIGNVHPHKNVERLISVFQRVHQDLPNIQLVLVGKDDYFQKRLKTENDEWKNEKDIIWTGFVEDLDLIPLIKGAAVFIFPSLMEGFGIPPLEAMACGTPVVASNVTSIPEVCGDAAYYFNPTDEYDMRHKIKEVLENSDLRLTLIQKGYSRVKDFSWQKLARQTIDVYNTSLGLVK